MLAMLCLIISAVPPHAGTTSPTGPLPQPAASSSAYFEVGGRQPTPAYLLSDLRPGHTVPGAYHANEGIQRWCLRGVCAHCARVLTPKRCWIAAWKRAACDMLLYCHVPTANLAGPAILIDDISTIVVEPRCTAHITATRDVRLELPPPRKGQQAAQAEQAEQLAGQQDVAQQQQQQQQQQQDGQEDGAAAAADTECDPIQLAIFSHR